MIKLIAASTVIIAGIAFGYLLSSDEKKEIEALEALETFLKYINRGIVAKIPLDVLFRSFGKKHENNPLAKLYEYRGSPGEKIAEWTRENKLTDIPGMDALLKTLGTLDGESQQEYFKTALSSFTEILAARKKEYAVKSRTYRAVSALTGAVIAVLLY